MTAEERSKRKDLCLKIRSAFPGVRGLVICSDEEIGRWGTIGFRARIRTSRGAIAMRGPLCVSHVAALEAIEFRAREGST